MIQPKWLVFMFFVWITLTFLGATLEQHSDFNYADSTGQSSQTTLEYLMDFKNVYMNQNETGTWTFVMINPNYFKTLYKVATWDFDFMQTDIGNMARWILFIPFTIAFIAMLVFTFVQLIQGFIPFT